MDRLKVSGPRRVSPQHLNTVLYPPLSPGVITPEATAGWTLVLKVKMQTRTTSGSTANLEIQILSPSHQAETPGVRPPVFTEPSEWFWYMSWTRNWDKVLRAFGGHCRGKQRNFSLHPSEENWFPGSNSSESPLHTCLNKAGGCISGSA